MSGIRTGPNASKRRLIVALITLLLAAMIGISDASGQAATDLGLGGKHTCVVLASGLVQCWGESTLLGDGTYTQGYSSSPRLVAGIVNAAAVECSNYHCCAVLADGEVRCWGSNQGGKLGVPGPQLVRNPVTVSLPTTATGIGAGVSHTCALLTDGRVFCWGENLLGQLGDGTRTVIVTPPNPPKISEAVGISTATAVTVGGGHSCALLADGSVRCWGRNSLGQLGVSTSVVVDCEGTPCSANPVTVTGLSGVTAVSAGTNHTCALLGDQTVRCWGSPLGLGDGSTTSSSTPVQVAGPLVAMSLGAGSVHHCAVSTTGELRCWGWNGWGQIGDATPVCNSCSSFTPIDVPALTGNVSAVAGGAFHTCAILLDTTVSCWGANDFGQLGDGTTGNSATPVAVIGLGAATSLTIVPSFATVSAGLGLSYTALGGTTPYLFSIATNSSGATIDGATGLYFAGGTGGVTDTVRVTDQSGNTADATVNVVPVPVDSDGDGLVDSFEASFNGAGIRVFNPSATPPHTASSTGDAFFGSTISSGDVTVILPPGTTAETQTTEIRIDFRKNAQGPGQNPAVEVSGVSLPPGSTKSIQMPFGDQTAVCIDDSTSATIDTVVALAGDCTAPNVEIEIPAQIGSVNSSSQFVVTLISSTNVQIDGLTHTAVISISDTRSIIVIVVLGIFVAVILLSIVIVALLRWYRRRGFSSPSIMRTDPESE